VELGAEFAIFYWSWSGAGVSFFYKSRSRDGV